MAVCLERLGRKGAENVQRRVHPSSEGRFKVASGDSREEGKLTLSYSYEKIVI